jgi:hypothetical protein
MPEVGSIGCRMISTGRNCSQSSEAVPDHLIGFSNCRMQSHLTLVVRLPVVDYPRMNIRSDNELSIFRYWFA